MKKHRQLRRIILYIFFCVLVLVGSYLGFRRIMLAKQLRVNMTSTTTYSQGTSARVSVMKKATVIGNTLMKQARILPLMIPGC